MAVVNAYEGQIMKIVDVSGAVYRGNGDKLLEIDKEIYLPYVTWEGNQKVMYVGLLKALYGTIKAVKLFWERLTKHLVEDWGFTSTPLTPVWVTRS